jgi:hypothetical protein
MRSFEIRFNYAKAQNPPIRFLDRIFGKDNSVIVKGPDAKTVLRKFAEQQSLNAYHLKIYEIEGSVK